LPHCVHVLLLCPARFPTHVVSFVFCSSCGSFGPLRSGPVILVLPECPLRTLCRCVGVLCARQCSFCSTVSWSMNSSGACRFVGLRVVHCGSVVFSQNMSILLFSFVISRLRFAASRNGVCLCVCVLLVQRTSFFHSMLAQSLSASGSCLSLSRYFALSPSSGWWRRLSHSNVMIADKLDFYFFSPPLAFGFHC